MKNRDRKARIVYWENDGEFIRVSYTQKDGQRVTADFSRMGWRKPPSEVLSKVMDILRLGPRSAIGRIQSSGK